MQIGTCPPKAAHFKLLESSQCIFRGKLTASPGSISVPSIPEDKEMMQCCRQLAIIRDSYQAHH